MTIKLFNEINKNEYYICGGKGASLSKMVYAGFNIPDGFVICSDVFDAFLIQNKIKDKINILLSECTIDDNSIIEDKSKLIKQLIEDSYINQEIQNIILEKFKVIDTKYVAVRSSATSEDGNASAWAGQLETYLNVTEQDIINNIKKCWSSIFNPRAIFYRLKKEDISDISVAVVVQKMIQSEISGVAFSVNPVTNAKEVVIEAVYGLGEALVSGSISPDSYIVNENNIDKKIKNQDKMLKMSKNSANEWILVDKSIKNNQKLDDQYIRELTKEVRKIEDYYRFPVDIEWSLQNNIIYILQCRPITTLKNSNLNEIISNITTDKVWKYYVTRMFCWFIWHNYLVFARSADNQERILGFSVESKNAMALNGDEYDREDDSSNKSEIFKNRFENSIDFFEELASKEFDIISEVEEYIKKIKKTDLSVLNKRDLMKIVNEFNEIYLRSCVTAYTRPDDFLEDEVKNSIKEELSVDSTELEEIFKKLSTCPNYKELKYSEEPLDLLKIAKKIKEESVNTDELIQNHINKYAWLKAPFVMEDIRFEKEDYLQRLEFLKDVDIDTKINNILKVRNKNDMAYEDILKRYSFSKRTLKLIKALRDFIFLRTYTTEFSDYLFYETRHTVFTEIAKRCNLQSADIVMLGMDEILEILNNNFIIPDEIKSVLNKRKEGFAIVCVDGEISSYVGKDALVLQSEIGKIYKINNNIDSSENIIKGVIANQGKVIGRVKILLEYNDIFNVEKGDIIVATMTTPDYVSAMEKSAGFITDEGGITCHAAIISREFDVPCIVGTNNATQKLKNGQLVELDAFNGKITILE